MILAKNYVNNVQYDEAFALLKTIPGYETECSELLFNAGKQSQQEALALLKFELKTLIGE